MIPLPMRRYHMTHGKKVPFPPKFLAYIDRTDSPPATLHAIHLNETKQIRRSG